MTETTLLLNGRFHTGDPGSADLQSLAIENGTIAAIGPTEEITSSHLHPIKTVDLQGQTVWPGLTDSHLHLSLLADRLSAVDCETESLEECLSRVKTASQAKPDRSWIIGYGWNHNAWHPPLCGTASQLDRVADARPVVLHAKSLHASWVNTAALKLANITSVTPDPPGGIILRDLQGNPTGILLENAMELVDKLIPTWQVAQLSAMLLSAQSHLLSLGVTGVNDFDHSPCFEALQALEKSDQLILRVRKNFHSEMMAEIAAAGLRSNEGSAHLFTGSFKCFADGALGPQSAAMLEPYQGSNSRGMLLMNAEAVFEVGQRAAELGWPLAIHAIGDAANRAVLDGYQQLRAYETANHLPHLKHRIEHVQIIQPADQARLKDLAVIASMQPIHATSDMYTADRCWGSRSAHAYAFQALEQQGVCLIFGSDAP
ncbi:MAG: amidohydrolase, partial [Anaerolineaceae bacterium]